MRVSSNQDKQATSDGRVAQFLSGYWKWIYGGTDRSIEELSDILWEEEAPEMLAYGTYNNLRGILVTTAQRVVHVNRGWFGSLVINDFAYDGISSIESRTGLGSGEITMYVSGKKERLYSIPNNQLRPFVDILRKNIPLAHGDTSDSPPVLLTSVAGELEKFVKLRDEGVISDDEFNAQKTRLLR